MSLLNPFAQKGKLFFYKKYPYICSVIFADEIPKQGRIFFLNSPALLRGQSLFRGQRYVKSWYHLTFCQLFTYFIKI
jgi:hypothetical protein